MYSIGEIADLLGISTSAIRFYDRQGLLPFVKRDKAGRRKFKPNDLNFLEVIDCLKKSGVPVKDIGHFIDLCMQGDDTLPQRYDYLDKEEEMLESKIKQMKGQLDFLRYKKWYYKTSVEAGTERIHFAPGTNTVDPNIKAQYQSELAHCTNLRDLIDLKQSGQSSEQK